MDDLLGKISELLSDKETVQQITELAQMFMSGDADGNDDSNGNTDSKKKPGESGGDGFDFGALFKLQEVMSIFNEKDKNTDLLIALKPHITEERRAKIDKAVKILRLIAVWNVVKDSGLLKDIL